ncbi:MAG: tyrosine--tRNA ligase [Deltaproteobacteria bacterium]|nr:tyrosine--tRNA ligase [Deltaproteobacteria bacterium]
MSFLEELEWRGLLHQTTADREIKEHLATPGRVGYCGFDPTSNSLTIGNLIPIKLLVHWQRAGHKPIVLIGGGTGLIGDPSGKDAERQLLDREQVDANIAGQRPVFERLLDFDPKKENAAVIVNNADWLTKLNFIEVLRDIGKHFSVNAMIQKDSVRERLLNREQGISYTEFSYQLLQAYDFLHLKKTVDCSVQIAGSDQYGNIAAGVDLIRRKLGRESSQQVAAFGITTPLVTRSDGKKIGKTEKGAVWLTADKTSPYAFYQFWINADDADVVSFLKWYTFLEKNAIETISQQHAQSPHQRIAQRELARHMTELLHGADALAKVEVASQALFSGDVRKISEEMLDEVFADVTHTQHDRALLSGNGLSLVELLPQTSLASSKREARQFLSTGAITVNGEKVEPERQLTTSDLLYGRTILIRRGKKNWHATRWR